MYDFWNAVDLLSYLLLIVALLVPHLHSSETFTLARRLYGLSLLVMYLRFLEVFLIHRKMGPTLIMIKEMVCILIFFHLSLISLICSLCNLYKCDVNLNYCQLQVPSIWSKSMRVLKRITKHYIPKHYKHINQTIES